MVSAKLLMICSGPRRSCDTEPLNASSSRLRHSSSSTSAARVSASCRAARSSAASSSRRISSSRMRRLSSCDCLRRIWVRTWARNASGPSAART